MRDFAIIVSILAVAGAFASVQEGSQWRRQARAEAREIAFEARERAREAREMTREAARVRIDFARQRRDFLREQGRLRREAIREVERELRRDWGRQD